MKLFLDNDAALKLAALDLLDEALEVLGATREEVFILASAPFAILKGKKRPPEPVASRLDTFFGQVGRAGGPNADDLKALQSTPGIDAGEAILFSLTAAEPGSILLTGDKRSLRALAGAEAHEVLRRSIAGRVICFEQILNRIVRHQGFGAVIGKLVAAISWDKSLAAILGSTPTSHSVDEGLASYIRSLRDETGALLAADKVPRVAKHPR
ncbi:MAG: hypothetical protein HY901_16530 [Deltaproteobacteria bacterium]|nr:hypothetical protein [Deltaproteobacteria bacterium]